MNRLFPVSVVVLVAFSSLFFESVSFAQNNTKEVPKDEAQVDLGKKPKRKSLVDKELEFQNQLIEQKQDDYELADPSPNADRYPETIPIFVPPPKDPKGGQVPVQHPNAAKGLVRIKDGVYQYKTVIKKKSQTGAFKLGAMSPPKLSNSKFPTVDFESMYGSSDLFGFGFEYEWQPFSSFGKAGLQIGSGLTVARGTGTFKSPRISSTKTNVTEAQESFSLYIVPISAFLVYRFDFSDNQILVPYINGGVTYYGMVEVRDDQKSPAVGGAPATGGGGGLMLAVSKLNPSSRFTLSSEYGIADMWVVAEGRYMTGLSQEKDFSNLSYSLGINFDF